MNLSPLVAWAAARSKAVVLLLLIYCLCTFPFVGVLYLSLFCYALLCVLSSFAIIFEGKKELIAFLLLSYGCLFTVTVLCDCGISRSYSLTFCNLCKSKRLKYRQFSHRNAVMLITQKNITRKWHIYRALTNCKPLPT